jgi:hypothetical protein
MSDTGSFSPHVAKAMAHAERLEQTENRLIMDEFGDMAREWDRFWKACECHDGNISVDDAIEKYKSLQRDVELLKKEVNHYHSLLSEKTILLNDWIAHEYDSDYDDEVANENMRDQREAYTPIYPEVEK